MKLRELQRLQTRDFRDLYGSKLQYGIFDALRIWDRLVKLGDVLTKHRFAGLKDTRCFSARNPRCSLHVDWNDMVVRGFDYEGRSDQPDGKR